MSPPGIGGRGGVNIFTGQIFTLEPSVVKSNNLLARMTASYTYAYVSPQGNYQINLLT